MTASEALAIDETKLETITGTAIRRQFTEDERQEAILALLPMARNIARGLAKFARGADANDCFNDGCLGVIRAVDTYDPARGVPLQRYARTIITGAILNGLRGRDPISEVARRRLRQAEARRFEIAHETGTLPSMQEMEKEQPELRSARLVAHRSDTLSLDVPLPPSERETPDWSADPATIAEYRYMMSGIQEAMNKLTKTQRYVIAHHYFAGKTATAIGAELNLTPQRISQIRTAALKVLREHLDA